MCRMLFHQIIEAATLADKIVQGGNSQITSDDSDDGTSEPESDAHSSEETCFMSSSDDSSTAIMGPQAKISWPNNKLVSGESPEFSF